MLCRMNTENKREQTVRDLKNDSEESPSQTVILFSGRVQLPQVARRPVAAVTGFIGQASVQRY